MRFAIISDRDSHVNPIGVILHTGGQIVFDAPADYHPALAAALDRQYAPMFSWDGIVLRRRKVAFEDPDYLNAIQYLMKPPLVVRHVGDIQHTHPFDTLVQQFIGPDVKLSGMPVTVMPKRR